MTVVNVKIQLLETHWQQMHYVSNVQVEDPVILLFNSKNCLDVVSQFREIVVRLRFSISTSCIIIGRLIQLNLLFLL